MQVKWIFMGVLKKKGGGLLGRTRERRGSFGSVSVPFVNYLKILMFLALFFISGNAVTIQSGAQAGSLRAFFTSFPSCPTFSLCSNPRLAVVVE